MDPSCLQYALTDEAHATFERDGYLVVRNVLPESMVADLDRALDVLDAKYRPIHKLKPHERLNHLDAICEDDIFLELIDWPQTFPKVWGILGWNIQLYHSHFIVTPPLPPGSGPSHPSLGWHQDSGRLNIELDADPRPRVSLKIGFFLADATDSDRGNLHVIPGSHLQNRLQLPRESDEEHADATPVLAGPGDAVFFDRRLWHAGGHNYSSVTRKVLFYGYSYRWLRPRDDMSVDRYLASADPIRRQLLGASPNGGFGYTSPADEDVPLKTWLETHQTGAASASAP